MASYGMESWYDNLTTYWKYYACAGWLLVAFIVILAGGIEWSAANPDEEGSWIAEKKTSLLLLIIGSSMMFTLVGAYFFTSTDVGPDAGEGGDD